VNVFREALNNNPGLLDEGDIEKIANDEFMFVPMLQNLLQSE
jgi:hypothetical protein